MPSLTIDTSPLDARPEAKLVVALSGGLDSTVLLHALALHDDVRRRGLRAVHVDHGLHSDSAAWAMHCASLCAGLGIAFESVRVQVDRSGAGLEGAARSARHAALQSLLGAGDVIAFAHHLDDQAETFLLRALRASGPDGLAAMRPWRAFGAGWLWRPLLDVPRVALEAHARAHGLSWIDDPSNADDRFDRNFLRLHVLPLLRQRWPHAGAALAQAAELAGQASRLLDDEDARLLAAVRHDPATLDVAALRALDPARRARVLRRWIASLGLPPLPAQGIACIERDLLGARPDTRARFAWRDAHVRRWSGLLHAGHVGAPLAWDWSTTWTGTAALELPDGGALLLDRPGAFPEPVQVRARAGGERIRLPARRHGHALKHVLQDLDVPTWDREHLPLLFAADGELLAAGDIAFSARFTQWMQTAGATLVWRRPGSRIER